MRFYPFGSGSILPFAYSASVATYAIFGENTLRTRSASMALTGSTGPTGDAGTPCNYTNGPYETYPPS